MEHETIDKECAGVRVFTSKRQHWSDDAPFQSIRQLEFQMRESKPKVRSLDRWLGHSEYDAAFHGPMPDSTTRIKLSSQGDPAIALIVERIHDALEASQKLTKPKVVAVVEPKPPKEKKKSKSKHKHYSYVRKPPRTDFKHVRCIETGIEYPSCKEAAELLGVTPNAVHSAARTGTRCSGNHWEWV